MELLIIGGLLILVANVALVTMMLDLKRKNTQATSIIYDLRQENKALESMKKGLELSFRQISAKKVVKSQRPIAPIEMWKRIESLDFSLLMEKLRANTGWGDKQHNTAFVAYKKFLYLFGTNVGTDIVPWDKDMELVWHIHILQMKKYAKDCETLFGEMLYHGDLLKDTAEHESDVCATENIRRKAFSSPQNTPQAIVSAYQSRDEEGVPWLVWWMLFMQDNPREAANLSYVSSIHSMDTGADSKILSDVVTNNSPRYSSQNESYDSASTVSVDSSSYSSSSSDSSSGSSSD